ncbi:ABC transporter permease [Rhizobium leguminosarum]|uniref:ABC transporter permease n=1 Tax=Rhizobium leguminosarum TaxID=384 RepID=UPI0021BBFFF1|nr:ABC transporter permease [Rhizobium leguminosarum]
MLQNAVWLILLVLLTGFCVFIPGYAQTGIFLNILEQSAFIGILSVGLSIAIIAGKMDLSIESTMALSAMLTAALAAALGPGGPFGIPWLIVPATLIIALFLGVCVGLFNALVVLKFGINAFIATLATYIFLRGAVVAFSGGRGIFGLPEDLRAIAASRIGAIPALAWITIAVFIICTFILSKTPFGRYIYLCGGNSLAPFRAGINTTKIAVWAFVIPGVLAAFAGWLLAARTAGATANLGIGMLFEAFAAVVIGGVSLQGGVGRLSGVFAGVLLLGSIRTAINLLGMPPQYTQMIQGGLVLAAMLLDSLKTSIRARYL